MSPPAQIGEAHRLTFERGQLERRHGCSDRHARSVEHVGDDRLDRVGPRRDAARHRSVGRDQHGARGAVRLEGPVELGALVDEHVVEPERLASALTSSGAPSLATARVRRPACSRLPAGHVGKQRLARAAVRAREEQEQRSAGREQVVERDLRARAVRGGELRCGRAQLEAELGLGAARHRGRFGERSSNCSSRTSRRPYARSSDRTQRAASADAASDAMTRSVRQARSQALVSLSLRVPATANAATAASAAVADERPGPGGRRVELPEAVAVGRAPAREVQRDRRREQQQERESAERSRERRARRAAGARPRRAQRAGAAARAGAASRSGAPKATTACRVPSRSASFATAATTKTAASRRRDREYQ